MNGLDILMILSLEWDKKGNNLSEQNYAQEAFAAWRVATELRMASKTPYYPSCLDD